MLQIQKILVPRDYTPCSDAALRYAADLARRHDAELHTLFAEVLYGEPDALHEQPSLDDVHVVHTVVRDVAAAPAILAYAEAHDVDLVVMGTHGRRGVRRLLLGSVAAEVVRLSHCPVLTMRSAPAATHAALRTLLVPIDFSQHARRALLHGLALADTYGARLHLLHVVEERLHPAFYNTGVFSIYDVQPGIEQQAEGHLRKLYADAGGTDARTRFSVVPGHAAHEIIRLADDLDLDLILMPTHGLTGLEHFFLGSVAEKVIRSASCPVLTLKPFGKSMLPPSTLRQAEALSPLPA